MNDIRRYSAVDNSNFMFEIAPPSKSRGQVFNLSVPNNADDISKAFDFSTSNISEPGMCHSFHTIV